VYPRHRTPFAGEPFADPPGGPRSVLLGLALLPLGIPLAWLLAGPVTGKAPVFTYAVPVSLALGAAGLCVGVVLAADWRFPTRVRGVLALTLLGYATAAFLYFLKPAWVEAVRRGFGGHDPARWQVFRPDDGAYSAKLPGEPRSDPNEVLAGWPLKAFRYSDRRNHADTYIVAHGPPPAAVVRAQDDQFFTAAGAGAAAAAGGTLLSEEPAKHGDHPARRFVIALADRATTRTVLVVRGGERVFVAAAEGAFLPPDAPDVKTFLNGFAPADPNPWRKRK
jgi:hypothetical protein